MIESLPTLRDTNTVNPPEMDAHQPYHLHLSWAGASGNDPAGEFAIALAGYLLSVRGEFVATTPTGLEVNALVLDEWSEIVRRNPQCTFTAQLADPKSLGKWQLAVERNATVSADQQQRCVIGISASAAETFSDLLWLQSNLTHSSPSPLIAIPTTPHGPSITVFNNLVVLASRFGRVESAELLNQANQSLASWTFSDPAEDAIPIYEHIQNALCLATLDSPSTVPKPACWLMPTPTPAPEPTTVKPVSKPWIETFLRILNNANPNGSDLVSLLHKLAPAPFPVNIVPLSAVLHSTKFMTPIHDGANSVLAPSETMITIGVDFEMGQDHILHALLHAYGHVVLGHVRAGDEYGHWDTPETIAAEQPHRRWDREVQEHFSPWFETPSERKVDSLADCTLVERAQLGLWRMIGEMIGESRRLHPLADRYQKAAYQRQAAQRIVAMLEDYGGAMLCDGVGLGKTYVATTLMVHYANMWKEHHPETLRTDPFRITVLSPNSVVSTWRREAIPPLSSFGVPLATVRVISHSKLSRITNNSDILQVYPHSNISDLEHLLLSELVIVDEAHNFRSVSAGRTKVLRDLLRIQPRMNMRRRVVLLTATPINNSLDDLRQQASLLFSRPIWLNDARTEDGYRRQLIKEIEERCRKARGTKRSAIELSGLVIYGQLDARFSDAIEFRDDLEFGPNVQRIGDYLKEQDKKLKIMQSEIRAIARASQPRETSAEPIRIAEELLDRIVVQRSRALCKEIERQQGSDIELLFRPDQHSPEKLRYSDEYDGIQDVLARFLPLFDAPRSHTATDSTTIKPLSLKVYMWHDLREGIKSINESSPVVGLQRILVLKRLESSPVSFLITLLRLLVLHAHRLQQLLDLCHQVRDEHRTKLLTQELSGLLEKQEDQDLEKLRMLTMGDGVSNSRLDFMKALSKSYLSTQSAADTDDPPPRQLSLFGDEEEDSPKREHLDRLWTLRESLLDDLATLFEVTPKLADIIFGRFEKSEWPRGFITGGVEDSDWPLSPAWGLRIVKDAKLRSLLARLLEARRERQKVIVFTQFSDTIAYIESVLRAARQFGRDEWQVVTRSLGLDSLKKEEVLDLLDSLGTVTGSTEDRDDIVNSFSPFYRIGPHRPVTDNVGDTEQKRLLDEWAVSWRIAIQKPRHVLISTDVLAEGVNLQDVSMMINFDVHWNPVRMIQRAGRIDRRLNPSIEKTRHFPELASLAQSLRSPVPEYYFHEHPEEPPMTVNMILPDELEAELQLRERIATKTLAIDFTLGLEQGTGAEADWMETYKYQGISSLNSIQRDRAIEQIASYHERLSKLFHRLGIKPEWSENLNEWFRAVEANEGSPLIGRALLGRRGGSLEPFSKYIEPTVIDNVPHWFWAEKKPGDSMFDGWLILDGRPENFPPHPNRDIPWNDNVSMPIKASHLLCAAESLSRIPVLTSLASREIGRPLMQGGSALAAPKLGSDEDRRLIALRDFFILQLQSFTQPVTAHLNEQKLEYLRRGISRPCNQCGHAPGLHKCCYHCGATANGEPEIEHVFGFRLMSDSRGDNYEVPQPWCRACRNSSLELKPAATAALE